MILASPPKASLAVAGNKYFNRILLVDDDAISLFLSRLVVEEAALAEKIISLSSVKATLAYLTEHCLDQQAALASLPDLILTDMNLPGADAFDLLAALQVLKQQHVLRVKVEIMSIVPFHFHQQQLLQWNIGSITAKPLTLAGVLELTADHRRFF
jgi:CheY-like chemotaxis protein